MKKPTRHGQSPMPRRDALRILGSVPAAVGLPGRAASAQAPPQGGAATAPGSHFKPRFFSEHEWRAANLLADMILPKDEHSPGAGEAGAVEYIDEYAVFRGEELQTRLRGGLAWLDRECRARFDRDFADCEYPQRKEVLDLVAHPAKARPEHRHALLFFDLFRDLTASGFYTTRAGFDDLGYLGNQAEDWQGCPPSVLEKLGVK